MDLIIYEESVTLNVENIPDPSCAAPWALAYIARGFKSPLIWDFFFIQQVNISDSLSIGLHKPSHRDSI